MKGETFFKKLGIYTALLAMLVPALYTVDFLVERSLHHLEMNYILQSNELQTITVDSASLHWIKPNKELLINGNFFDVGKIDFKNGKAIVKGLFDTREKSMHIAYLSKSNSKDASNNTSRLIGIWLQKTWSNDHFLSVLIAIQTVAYQPVSKPFAWHPIMVPGPDKPPPRL